MCDHSLSSLSFRPVFPVVLSPYLVGVMLLFCIFLAHVPSGSVTLSKNNDPLVGSFADFTGFDISLDRASNSDEMVTFSHTAVNMLVPVIILGILQIIAGLIGLCYSNIRFLCIHRKIGIIFLLLIPIAFPIGIAESMFLFRISWIFACFVPMQCYSVSLLIARLEERRRNIYRKKCYQEVKHRGRSHYYTVVNLKDYSPDLINFINLNFLATGLGKK